MRVRTEKQVELVVTVLVLLFVLCVVVGGVVAFRVARAVSRGVERTGVQVRRGVEEAGLKAKAAQPGAVGQVARARLELRSSIDGTRRYLEASVARDPELRESLGLLDRLHTHARELDGELQMLADGAGRARVAERLPDVQARVERVVQSAESLRSAAADRAQRFDAEGLDSLHSQIEMESGALRHWEQGTGQSGPEKSELPEGGEHRGLPGDGRRRWQRK
ncbi:hypothetical protein [Streptomyces sulphureus]|uniref:hypothetical protein n=1 Tax=Streptomyces sulphureus TaxID=47758 RepID=UPI0003770AC8|nr:hypothetical protein [Streptomyces sulphureus]